MFIIVTSNDNKDIDQENVEQSCNQEHNIVSGI